ncbi:MAG: DUF1573 domain-containing protein [Flavobacteriia bacterium]|nr:DUF1573 domain-containing protein [Flavobacteriia bacterium]
MKKSLIVFVGGILFLTACSETQTSKSDGEVVSAIASGSEEDQALIKENAKRIAEEEANERELAKTVTTLKFDKEVHDFGEIATGSENKCVFKVTNTGKYPLKIVDVGASCGCTTPKKPEHPILPGKSDVIEVGFKPNGPVPSEKTVTIQANTDPRISTVKVKAMVK